MKSLVLSVLLVVGAMPGWGQSGQSTKKIAVKFSCSCSDTVGRAYATALRDALAESPRYREVYTAIEKLPNGNTVDHWHIIAVSVDPSQSKSGYSTAIAITFLFGNTYFLTEEVKSCGMERVKECAQDTISDFDNLMNDQ